jgi:hypothetical protein
MRIEGVEKIIRFEARKRHGYSQDCGTAFCAYTLCGLFNRFAGIYRVWRNGSLKIPQRMVFYWIPNPRTTSQQANRTRFADAMAAWSALTSDEKAKYNKRAKSRNIIGYNLYVKEYMLGYI